MPSQQLLALRARFAAAPFDPAARPEALRRMIDSFGDAFRLPEDVTVEPMTLGSRPAERLVCDKDGPALLYLHGGGFVIGSPKSHRHLAAQFAKDLRGVVYTLDYRLSPEAPFPAALNDVLNAWRDLQARHPAVSVAGDSAGGGLAFSMCCAARDAGMRLPHRVVTLSPWVELGTANESYALLAHLDHHLSREVADWYAGKYVGETDRTDPRVSPLRADLRGLPRTLIQIGDHEVFFGDAVLMHQRLLAQGVASSLSVWNEMFHVWHLYWPLLKEGRDAIAQAAAFVSGAQDS